MERNHYYIKKKIFVTSVIFIIALVIISFKLAYIMVFESEHYTMIAEELHERERDIKAKRGKILDCNGQVIADNKTVCSISVIRSQITDRELVIRTLCEELNLSEEYVRKRVEKFSAREIIKSNVEKEIGDRIRKKNISGIKIDEDYKRDYPFGELASKVIGFTGGDNQGILGLEVIYNQYLTGINGQILTMTDAKGLEQTQLGERRKEAIPGMDLYTSIDLNIQKYAMQLSQQVLETKQADGVSIIVMNAKNGEILTLTDVPEYDLNDPFTLTPSFEKMYEVKLEELSKPQQTEEGEVIINEITDDIITKVKQDTRNTMWRNTCIHDTYEPGSIFKIITASAGLEAGVVKMEDTFHCPGYIVVEDRRIRCARVAGHGSETFVQGFMNSCNPVFITLGLRIGVDRYYSYFDKFLLGKKTGIDLPGEAVTIMHKKENVGEVELATISFGQSFQLTPVRLMTTVAALIHEGNVVVPHFGVKVADAEQNKTVEFTYPAEKIDIQPETSEKIRYMMEKVVTEGGGKNGAVEGYRIGGKTATSQTLPRGSGKYISSFMGTYPADDPVLIAMVIIRNPKGQYYGGMIAAPVMRQLFENILPYLENKGYN